MEPAPSSGAGPVDGVAGAGDEGEGGSGSGDPRGGWAGGEGVVRRDAGETLPGAVGAGARPFATG